MLRHHNIETHKKIEILNKCQALDKREHLINLINQYKDLPEFQYGEPFLQLEYAKATYASWPLGNYKQAIEIAQKALSHEKSFCIDSAPSSQQYSNVELSLINVIALNYCRSGDFENGQKCFDFLYHYIEQLFEQSHYATNRNNHFEVRFLSTLVYNLFVFSKGKTEGLESRVDYALSLLKSLHSHNDLPELLLCKTYFFLLKGDINSATSTYQTAHYLGLYLYEQTYQEHIEQSILEDKLSCFIKA